MGKNCKKPGKKEKRKGNKTEMMEKYKKYIYKIIIHANGIFCGWSIQNHDFHKFY